MLSGEARKRKWEKIMASSTYQIVDIHKWMNGWNNEEILNENAESDGDGDGTKNSRGSMLPMVDLRSYEDFEKQHIALHRVERSRSERHEEQHDIIQHNDNVPIVNLPLSTLLSGERSCELPPRHVEFAILIPRQYTQLFIDNGEGEDCCIHELFFASQSKSTLQSRKPWLVRQVLIDSDELWHEASKMRLVQSCSDKGSTGRNSHPFQILQRLWKPDPLVSSYVLPLLKEWITEKREYHDSIEKDRQQIATNNLSTGVVLDLGSGAGRDICYLAEEVKQFQYALLQKENNQVIRSVQFVGIDNHKGSAKRCLPLWKNRGVDDMTHSALLDLNKLHLVREHFMDTSKLLTTRQPTGSGIICIFAIRFLNRNLLSYIANSQSVVDDDEKSIINIPKTKNAIHSPPPSLVLPIGTILAISHFCKPKEGASWTFEHPKESSVLDRWELKNLFDERRWQILRDDLILDGDHGRTLIQFVAKKIA